MSAQAPAKIQEGDDAAMFAALENLSSFARKHELTFIGGRDEDGGPWSAELVVTKDVRTDIAPNPVSDGVTVLDWKASGYNSLAEAVAAVEKDYKKFKKGHVRISPDYVPGRMSPDMVAPPAPAIGEGNANT